MLISLNEVTDILILKTAYLSMQVLNLFFANAGTL